MLNLDNIEEIKKDPISAHLELLNNYEKGLISLIDNENFENYNANEETTDQIEIQPSERNLQREIDLIRGENELIEDELAYERRRNKDIQLKLVELHAELKEK